LEPTDFSHPDKNISLVIPVRNEVETINRLVDSIRLQTRPPDEVIFVDGGSSDGTIDYLKTVCKGNSTFRLIMARKALPGQGRNIGAANAIYDWIAFTDAGNVLERDWLEQLVAVADSDPQTAIVCGNFEPVTDSLFTESAAIAYLPATSPSEAGDIRFPFIASSLVRRDVWQAVGGFPELRAAEDLIFFEELERRGFTIKRAPTAMVHWELQKTLWKTFRRFFIYSRVNVWAGRQRHWHYGVARLYLIGLPFVALAIWNRALWILVPILGLCARVFSHVWQHRGNHGLWWILNPLRLGCVLLITLVTDLATFSGWISALPNRREAARIKSHLITRRG